MTPATKLRWALLIAGPGMAAVVLLGGWLLAMVTS